MYSKDILKMVLEKFYEIPFTNKKVACRRQAMQRVMKIICKLDVHVFMDQSWVESRNLTFLVSLKI